MYVTIDEEIKIAQRRLRVERLRQRGPVPRLDDAEVLAMECVGEFLGLDCDKHLFAYFRRHFGHIFPATSSRPWPAPTARLSPVSVPTSGTSRN